MTPAMRSRGRSPTALDRALNSRVPSSLPPSVTSTSNGDALYRLVPGGRRQHEFALRGGINLVMYALTGNYKADQVHAPALLERLGQ